MHSVDVPEQLLRFADEALGKPYHAALVTQSPSAGVSALHGHADFFEFMGVLDGHGRQLLPGGAQWLRAGDVALVRPRDRHALQGLSPGGMRFVNIAFPAKAWQGFADLVRLPDATTAADPPVWRLEGVLAGQAQQVFRRALDRFHHKPTMLDVLRFWTDLVELLGAGRAEPAAGGRPDWLGRVCAEMRREENLRGGVPRMLRLAAVSPAHLSRSMRSYKGTTPTAFVNELRLERAAELLATTTEPVTRIAYRCGFSSQSYFTRCFGVANRVAPTEYRRRAWQAFVPEATRGGWWPSQ